MSTPLHTGTNRQGVLNTSNDLLICRACGTQYQTTEDEGLKSCRICDDPRQYIPASGQSFTTMGNLHQSPAGHKLVFKQENDPKIWAITIEPNVGIGQRALLIQTPYGNVLWDLVCYLDEKAVEKVPCNITFPVSSLCGSQASHPFRSIPAHPTAQPLIKPTPDQLPRRPLPDHNLPPPLLHNLGRLVPHLQQHSHLPSSHRQTMAQPPLNLRKRPIPDPNTHNLAPRDHSDHRRRPLPRFHGITYFGVCYVRSIPVPRRHNTYRRQRNVARHRR